LSGVIGEVQACFNNSGRIGIERIRMPVEAKTALAMAGATAIMGVSPPTVQMPIQPTEQRDLVKFPSSFFYSPYHCELLFTY